jgi:hypothetical protein
MSKERKPSDVCDLFLNICEAKKFFPEKVKFKEKINHIKNAILVKNLNF